MSISLDTIKILPFPEKIDFNNNETINTIIENGKQFNILANYFKENREDPMVNNFPFTAKIVCYQVQATFNKLVEQINSDADHSLIESTYEFLVKNFNNLTRQYDFSKVIEEWKASIDILINEYGFIHSWSLYIWTCQQLFWQHGIFMIAFNPNVPSVWNIINLTCEVNAYHVNASWGFCANNTFQKLSVFIKNNDFSGLFIALGALISWYDDKAHHMASPKDFAVWKKVFHDLILEWKEYKNQNKDIDEVLSWIPVKTKHFIENLERGWYFKWIEANEVKRIISEIKKKTNDIYGEIASLKN